MKKIILLCAAVMCVALIGCTQDTTTGSSDADGSPKIAVVDPAKVFQDSKPGKDGMAYLEKVSAEVQKEFQDLQQKAAQGKGQSPESVNDIQAKVAKIQERVTAEQQMVVNKLNELFQKVLEKYRNEKGVAVVIPAEQALSYDASADATADIVAMMDKEDVTFETPMPALEKENPGAVKQGETKADDAKKDAAKPETAPEKKSDAKQ